MDEQITRDPTKPFESDLSPDQHLTFETAQVCFGLHDIDFSKDTLKAIGVLADDGRVTNLGLLVSDQNPYGIRIVKVDLANPAFALEEICTEGSILHQIEVTQDYLEGLNQRTLFGPELSYPRVAVREAIMNLFTHRDFESPVQPIVKIWPDRLEFINGRSGECLEAESLKLGISLEPNPRLAALYFNLEQALGIGSGVTRIEASYAPFDVRPQMRLFQNAFMLTLPNPAEQPSSRERERRAYEQTENMKVKEAMRLFSDSDTLSRKDVDDALGVSQTRSSAIIRDLIAMDVIEKVGTGRNIRYRHKH